MTRRFLGYGRQTIDDADIAAVAEVLNSDFLTQGPVVERFEAALAERVGADHAVAVSSGTAGLHIACMAAGMDRDSFGVTAAMTFVASVNCIKYTGARAGLVDITGDGLGMSPDHLGEVLAAQPEISVVIPVHFGGLACDGPAIRRIAGDRIVIEDACHSLGGDDESGAPVGACRDSDMAVFSFHPVKSMTTAEGGAVVTNDPDLAESLRRFRNHGIERSPEKWTARDGDAPAPWYYEQQSDGFNYRLSELHAALGLSQLQRMDAFIARRREIARFYDEAFSGMNAVTPAQTDPAMRRRSAMHLYVLRIDWARTAFDRGTLMEALKAHGVGTQVHYIPVYHHPIHRHLLDESADGFPVTESYYEACLSIPLHPSMSDEDASRVVITLQDLLAA